MEFESEKEVPEYFLCPISLQLMKDPVTAVTGITYERESIEKWLSRAAVCPVTKEELPPDSFLTPNHVLLRMIRSWCDENRIGAIPTARPPISRAVVEKMIHDLNRKNDVGVLKKVEELAGGSDANRRLMTEAGAGKAVIGFVVTGFREKRTQGLEEALKILRRVWFPVGDIFQIRELVEALIWVVSTELPESAKTTALEVLKTAMEVADASLQAALDPSFFTKMVGLLLNKPSERSARAILQILLQTTTSIQNKSKLISAGAIFAAIELELGSPEKRTTEATFCLLAHLCSCAEGRQKVMEHAAGLAVVAKRILRISAVVDDRGMSVIEHIARFTVSREVAVEMLRANAVAKLCMVLQADCANYLKMKAREILKLHSHEWTNSPCVQVYLVTRFKH